jgi:tetratricopeptide (TPR) repeat protein
MTRRIHAFVSALVLSGAACGPAVTVTHLEPATYNLGPARRLVLVEVEGNFSGKTRVARAFLEQVASGGVFTIQDATRESVRLAALGSGAAARDAKAFRRNWPADVYVGLGIELHAQDRTEHRKKKTDNGEVDVVSYFAEATCALQVRLLDANDGRDLATYGLNQTGRSSTSDTAKSGMRGEAEDHAVDSAVADAVSQFTPRRVQERLALDKKAPLAEEGLKLVDAGDLVGARKLWEDALNANPGSAPLRYNLGALSEALRDRRAARQYYEDAIRLNPGEAKYREALDALEARARDSKAMKKPG